MHETRDLGKLLAMRATRPRELAQSAIDWWCREAVNLLPQRMAALLTSDGRPTIVVGGRASGVTVRLTDPRSGIDVLETAAEGTTMTVIKSVLKRHGLDRHEVDLGLRLPEQQVFCRDILLPLEAKGALDTIVPQDLLKRTPFKAEDIYSDHSARVSSGGRIAVRQWVTRREHVRQAADQLGVPLDLVTFVMFGDEAAGPSIRLARKAVAHKPHRIAIAALCCLAVVLGAGVAGLRYARQQTTLNQLDADISVARRSAERVRAMIDQLRDRRTVLVRLRLQRSELPGLIDVWDQTTRLLPRHSWLTELRLDGANPPTATVTMTGFSAAAPSLVSVLDGSKLFVDAALTSPVAMDPVEGRERFSLQAKVRLPDALKEVTQ